MSISELNKPNYVDCEHIIEGGCNIYEQRPPTCAGWRCAWLRGDFEDMHKPNRVGVVLDSSYKADIFPGGHAYVAREAFPGGFDTASGFLRALARMRVIVIMHQDGRRFVLGPGDLPRKLTFVEYKRAYRRLPLV